MTNSLSKSINSFLSGGVFIMILFSCQPQLPELEDLPAAEALPEQLTLPDPFLMLDGTKIETQEDWYNKRRPELKRLFQHYVYGYLPPTPEMTFKTVKTDPTFFNGKATYKEVIIRMHLPDGGEHQINLALFVPNNSEGPVPVFIGVNKCGNHMLVKNSAITIVERDWIDESCSENYSKRGERAAVWAIENSINRGYAVGTYAVADMDPDRHDWSDGIHAKYKNTPGDSLTRWGTIAAWAWGLHRVVDYFETDSDIDKNRICITGWSRRGKTALFAAAIDDRIDLVVPHQSGTGGMALSRMHPNETIKRINDSFPHWFNNNFTKFNEDVNRLPIDQHLLVALVAPRPLMDDAGLKDTWASPHLALEGMKAATPVYEFLGEKGIVGEGFVQDSIGTIEMGRLLQFQRDTKHELDIHYWNAMLDFADIQFNRPVGKR